MTNNRLPHLDPSEIGATRDALHAWSRVLGAWLKLLRPKRKHWWHASLRPSLNGLTTGVVFGPSPFEMEIDLVNSSLCIRVPGSEEKIALTGQSQKAVAGSMDKTLREFGLGPGHTPDSEVSGEQHFDGYSADCSRAMQRVLSSVTSAMQEFRAEIREETSPIQVWPHHFDLSMIWLPGPKVEGQDPANEEYADKQMNIGFVFGDDTIAEPYFYVTAYPVPEELPEIKLPEGSRWVSDGFNGAVLLYSDWVRMNGPHDYLLGLWSVLMGKGHKYLVSDD